MATILIIAISLFLLSALAKKLVDKETSNNLNILLKLLLALFGAALVFIVFKIR